MLGSVLLVLLGGVLVSWLIYVHEHHTRIDRLTRNWPQPRSWPIMGHLHLMIPLAGSEFFKHGSKLIFTFIKDHRVKLWLGHRLYFFDCNPKDIQALCSAQQLLEKTADYRFFENWLCEGIFTSRVEKWTHRRKMLSPSFNSNSIREFAKIFERQARILVFKLGEVAASGEPVDFFRLIATYTLDTICETALGVSVGAQKSNNCEYFDYVREALHIVDCRIKNLFYRNEIIYKFTALAARERRVVKALHNFTDDIIKKRCEELKSDQANRNTNDTVNPETEQRRSLSYLDTLLHATAPDGKPLKVTDIREEVDTIIYGGFDLTAATIKFFLYRMTLHMDYQKRCREEIWQVCGRDSNADITIEQMRQLIYLEWCLKEILRLYPSAPIVARHARADCVINDFCIPAGSNVIISPLYMGRCKEFFPDPLTFNPERWSPDAEPKIEPSTFIPFMTGGRSCIGQRYAMVMMKLVLAHCLRNFEFEAASETDREARLTFVVTLHTMKPVFLRVKAV
ncbi:probable cytochrome P450 312a1 [Scaptodrosophila lebanonensis]|uniref:Probable cytochrome P450 312a1 n=1 Tax=Drosophila lebanonensis TaxID=7225 RepID=A0A6J2TBK7_DROLE|nr:probable cytochrome P450 312a1 [Scaptodrosophila lebanonensis]